ncbi:hypothetical protein UFOVP307_47 [uncultured Caudovirales phage]|uniref:Uncharacterized protein n=1 Tax=uncultured Caudovirales phage TaxID=2100421 RepID=A0A6J5LQG4_9CAUD|nr:hypothetical protein UFOVP307_47 [uncultured Caudovirales phage]
MTKEDIEHMWKVASNNPNHDTNWHDPVVIRFANLVASAEREACAKLCWSQRKYWDAEACADALRARGQA